MVKLKQLFVLLILTVIFCGSVQARIGYVQFKLIGELPREEGANLEINATTDCSPSEFSRNALSPEWLSSHEILRGFWYYCLVTATVNGEREG